MVGRGVHTVVRGYDLHVMRKNARPHLRNVFLALTSAKYQHV
jgi:hypothetical protein